MTGSAGGACGGGSTGQPGGLHGRRRWLQASSWGLKLACPPRSSYQPGIQGSGRTELLNRSRRHMWAATSTSLCLVQWGADGPD